MEAFWKQGTLPAPMTKPKLRPKGPVRNPNGYPANLRPDLAPDQPNYVHGVYASRRELAHVVPADRLAAEEVAPART